MNPLCKAIGMTWCAVLLSAGWLPSAARAEFPSDDAIAKLSAKEILATVEHLQRLVREAQGRQREAEERADHAVKVLGSAQEAVIAAKMELAGVQQSINALAGERDAASARAVAAEARAGKLSRRCWWMTGALALCALWIFRKPLVSLL